MSTLFVSDLDGTLLRSDQTLSPFTVKAINHLTERGIHFSYATGRSLITAEKVTCGIDRKIPRIVYNGAFIMEADGKILHSNFFSNDGCGILTDLLKGGIFPIVYAFIDGCERFTFVERKSIGAMKEFNDSRKGDIRLRTAKNEDALYDGRMFYFTCISDRETLTPYYLKYKDHYHTVFHKEMYTKAWWLEILPKSASKANAAIALKNMLGLSRIVAFGDAANDKDLFEIADERYAVENASEEIKRMATTVIEKNDEDGVAKYLLSRFPPETMWNF